MVCLVQLYCAVLLGWWLIQLVQLDSWWMVCLSKIDVDCMCIAIYLIFSSDDQCSCLRMPVSFVIHWNELYHLHSTM